MEKIIMTQPQNNSAEWGMEFENLFPRHTPIQKQWVEAIIAETREQAKQEGYEAGKKEEREDVIQKIEELKPNKPYPNANNNYQKEWDERVKRLKAEIKELDNLYVFGFYFVVSLLVIMALLILI